MEKSTNKNDLSNKEILDELQMISKKEVASAMKVSTSTIDRWVKAGLLKCVKLGKDVQQARVYFHLGDVVEFKNKNYGYR